MKFETKDEWKEGMLYFTQHPYDPETFLLSKAVRKGHKKMLDFFSSDSWVMSDYELAAYAKRVYLCTEPKEGNE